MGDAKGAPGPVPRRNLEDIEWLRAAADAVAEKDPQVAAAGIGGRLAYSTHGILAFRSHFRRQMRHASSRLGECGGVPTLVAILAGRRMSMTSCATLPPRLGWDLGRKALLPIGG